MGGGRSEIQIRKREGMDCCWSKIHAKAVTKEEKENRASKEKRK
jgi:hypothetical protein